MKEERKAYLRRVMLERYHLKRGQKSEDMMLVEASLAYQIGSLKIEWYHCAAEVPHSFLSSTKPERCPFVSCSEAVDKGRFEK